MNISQYTDAIRAYMSREEVDAPKAVDRFLVNLAVMRDHYVGFDTSINFRTLGQRWNSMSSDERLSQRAKLLAQLSRGTRREVR